MQGIRNTIAHNFRLVFLILFFFTSFHFLSFSQQNLYESDLLPADFHVGRREALRALMPPNSCAVIFSNPVRNRSNDVDFQYSQDPDFYYLCGITEPGSVLLVFSNEITWFNKNVKEILFVQSPDPTRESWTGKRVGMDGASRVSGVSTVVYNKYFTDSLPDPEQFSKILVKYPVDIKEASGPKHSINAMVFQFKGLLDKAGKESNTPSLLKAMAALREIKQPLEIALMQKAIDVTCRGIAEAIRAMEPDLKEFQAQAIAEFYFKHGGAEYPGYGSIAGSGENSCVLHYVTNRKTLSDGDMLVMDMGAEYHGYCADVTRTIPVNGKFSPEQKIIYNLVLEAQQAGIRKARPGNNFYDPNSAATEIIGKGLVKLGIIREAGEVKKYFNHGTSHYLGLEVHDAGTYGPLKPGMIITVEPGIYIPEGSSCDKKWWNIGVRIEDDVLITDNEPVVMSDKVPKSVDEIEKLMLESSVFDIIK